MEPINIILLELMFIEILVLIILSVIIKRKYPKTREIKEKQTIKQKLKSLKPEQYVIIALYIIIFATVGYFLIANLFPDNPINTNGRYSLEASDIGITSELRSLYLDKDYVLGGKTEINNKTVRLIISEEPFNFIFNPKKVIQENTPAEIQLSFLKPSTEVYLNDKLIIPDLDGYEKVKSYRNEEIWVKKELVKSKYKLSNNAENFIYTNFPGHTIYSFAELDGGTPIIQDYSQEETIINTQFRDNLKLAVYAEGNLDIEFIKQDLNNYVGADEYTVEIKDFQGESFFNETYEDDGNKKDTKVRGGEQDFEINLKNLPRNIYYIIFTKDKYNKASDSTIKDIKINSNKVLILGTILPLEAFEFYTKINSPKTIRFNYWHNGKDQKIKVSGDKSKTINLDEDWKGKTYEEEFKKGEYYFDIPKGDLWVYTKAISLDKENWFYFPQKADSKLIDSDIIIIDKDKLEINGDEVFYKEKIEISEDSKFKIQVLDKTQIYFEKIKLIF